MAWPLVLGAIASLISAYSGARQANTPKPPTISKTGQGGITPAGPNSLAADIAKTGAQGAAARGATPATFDPATTKTAGGITSSTDPTGKPSLGSILEPLKSQMGMAPPPQTQPKTPSVAQGVQQAVDVNPTTSPGADKSGKSQGTSAADTLGKIQTGAALTGTAMEAMRSSIPPPPNPTLSPKSVQAPTPISTQYQIPYEAQRGNQNLSALLQLLRSGR